MRAAMLPLLLLAAHLAVVHGHVFMSFPPARQFTNYKRTGEMGDEAEPMTAYGGRKSHRAPQCATRRSPRSTAGVAKVSNNNQLVWPNGNP